MRIFSIGHSNRTASGLLDALLAFKIEALADVRSLPRSKANPQFNAGALEKVLPQVGIEYAFMGQGLGGFRKGPSEGSLNRGWREAGFRRYADYALTEAFSQALSALESLGREKLTVFMCAELIFTRCHRRIISDHLAARGWDVVHIIDAQRFLGHRITPFARIEGTAVTYPEKETKTTLDQFL